MVVVESDDGGSREWVIFYIELGALGRAVPQVRAYPFDEHSGSESLEWRTPIDTLLAGAARQMFTTAPFRLGIVGFESSLPVDADELRTGDPPGL